MPDGDGFKFRIAEQEYFSGEIKKYNQKPPAGVKPKADNQSSSRQASMTAAELLDTLESRALLPGEVLTTLRQQVSRSAKIVTPESLAKLLVGKGLITAFQAEQLLAMRKAGANRRSISTRR